MKNSFTAAVSAVACACVLFLTGPAAAEYPEKPITVIVPNKAGGDLDIVVRLVAEVLSEELAQPVVIKNMPGAGTAIGSREAHAAKADGYTILANHEALITLSALGRLGFDIDDLEPLAKTGGFANFLAAGKDTPFDSFAELCTYAKEHPGEVSAAVQIGALSHFHMISAANACDIDVNMVNTTGGGAAFRAGLMGGTIDLAPMPAAAARGLMESGDAKVLAFLSNRRHPDLPDVPTTSELGYDLVEGDFNFYWWVKDAVPAEVKATLTAALEEAFKDAELKERLNSAGMVAQEFLSGDAVAERIAQKRTSIQSMAEDAGLTTH